MKIISRFKVLIGALGLAVLSVGPAQATVILEGSDAIGLHSSGTGSSFANTYRDQVWTAIGGADARPIAFIGDSLGGKVSTTHPIVTFSSVAAAKTAGAAAGLGAYVALYFQAGGGCCSENDGLITAAGAATDVGNYLAVLNGTVMIGDYTGGAAWDFAVGTTGGGNAHVSGFSGGIPGSGCSDGEVVTATGLANGFTQPGSIGCWTHQSYDQAGFFAPLGFTFSFFDAGPGYPAGFSSLLSNGKTVTGVAAGVPEPDLLALLAIGVLGFGLKGLRRRRS